MAHWINLCCLWRNTEPNFAYSVYRHYYYHHHVHIITTSQSHFQKFFPFSKYAATSTLRLLGLHPSQRMHNACSASPKVEKEKSWRRSQLNSVSTWMFYTYICHNRWKHKNNAHTPHAPQTKLQKENTWRRSQEATVFQSKSKKNNKKTFGQNTDTYKKHKMGCTPLTWMTQMKCLGKLPALARSNRKRPLPTKSSSLSTDGAREVGRSRMWTGQAFRMYNLCCARRKITLFFFSFFTPGWAGWSWKSWSWNPNLQARVAEHLDANAEPPLTFGYKGTFISLLLSQKVMEIMPKVISLDFKVYFFILCTDKLGSYNRI